MNLLVAHVSLTHFSIIECFNDILMLRRVNVKRQTCDFRIIRYQRSIPFHTRCNFCFNLYKISALANTTCKTFSLHSAQDKYSTFGS